MSKRWLLGAGALILLGAAWLIWEPHWHLIGWWRGEAFYQGKPTSYWVHDLDRWSEGPGWGGLIHYVRQPSSVRTFLGKWISALSPPPFEGRHPLQAGDPAARAILEEIREQSEEDVFTQRFVISGLMRIQ